MNLRIVKSVALFLLTAVFAACGPSGPIIVVHVFGSAAGATTLDLSVSLNDQQSTQHESFAPSATELHLQLPEGSLGKLALTLDAVNCHGCVIASGSASDYLVGAEKYELDVTLVAQLPPRCPTGKVRTPRWWYTPVLLDRGPHSGQVLLSMGEDFAVTGIIMETEIYDPATLTSQLAAPLPVVVTAPRRLPDGRWIFEGGYDPVKNAYSTATAIYNQISGAFSQPAPMQIPQSGHTAVVMADGRLMVIAGKTEPPRDLTARVQIYDPATDRWSFADNLPQRRLYPSAVLLKNGKVLVAGGISDLDVLSPQILLFDPAAQAGSQWSVIGFLSRGRMEAFSHLLPDGRFFIAAGRDVGSTLDEAEIFDPSLPGSTATVLPPAPYTFDNASFLALADGSVLVTGGGSTIATNNTQLFSPTTNRWEVGPQLMQPRAAHTSVQLPNGAVLLLHGVGGPILYDARAVGLLTTELLYLQGCP